MRDLNLKHPFKTWSSQLKSFSETNRHWTRLTILLLADLSTSQTIQQVLLFIQTCRSNQASVLGGYLFWSFFMLIDLCNSTFTQLVSFKSIVTFTYWISFNLAGDTTKTSTNKFVQSAWFETFPTSFVTSPVYFIDKCQLEEISKN